MASGGLMPIRCLTPGPMRERAALNYRAPPVSASTSQPSILDMSQKPISTFWDCEPYLKAALINAGERGDSAAIDAITADLHELHPDMQRNPSDGLDSSHIRSA